MRSVLTIGASCTLLACVPPDEFRCLADSQCSSVAGGTCLVDGLCGYPDSDCPSRRRYGDHAGSLSSTCVPATPPKPPGPLPDSCDGVECSGEGVCVLVDDAPTCACAPGLYSVGVECLDDPCDSVNCYFVDAERGDDANDGRRDTPWRTLERLRDALAGASPGDHFLLHRGRQWAEPLRVEQIAGLPEAPIVVGAYGPREQPKPRIDPATVRVFESEHVIVRDLWVEGETDTEQATSGPCLMIESSHHIIAQGNTLVRCASRGIRIHRDASYTTLVDNELRDIVREAGIFVSDTEWAANPDGSIAVIGPHHWVVDNFVTGAIGDGIAVGSVDAVGDIKLVGNVVTDVGMNGLSVEAAGKTWVVGNTVARAGVSSGGGLGFAGHGPIAGNVMLYCRYGFDLSGSGPVRHNTVVHAGTEPALEIDADGFGRTITDNLIHRLGAGPWLRFRGDPPALVDAMDTNWYADDGAGCPFEIMGESLEFAAFVEQTGLDLASRCAAVPGFGDVPENEPSEAGDAQWEQTLWPDASWARCDDPAGARGCDGTPQGIRLPAIEGFEDNGGRGWAGPLVVRQRYSFDP